MLLMKSRSHLVQADQLRRQLIELLKNFEHHLKHSALRQRVRELIPANCLLRELGGSLIVADTRLSARDRILAYLRKHIGQVIDGDELMVVAGISEYARRIRELRVEHGWSILSGNTARDMRERAGIDLSELPCEDLPPQMRPDQYLLQEDRQDRDAAHRWHSANRIRKRNLGVKEKLLEYFRENIGTRITSEELRYVAREKSEWARRTRELRTEEGWPIVTRFNGDPNLPIGVYILARDEQAPAHDRHIKEIDRREVMRRDNYSCRWAGCGWSKELYNSDPRYLEVHHIRHHKRGGANVPDNLVTLCNLHHDEHHRTGELKITHPDGLPW